jgi:hypothetical protein
MVRMTPTTRPSSDEQERLCRAIADALFKSVPEEWDEIRLQITPGESWIQLEVTGPGGIPNLRVPDDSLYEPAGELYALFQREARAFQRCDFQLRWDEGGEFWQFAADFTYPP